MRFFTRLTFAVAGLVGLPVVAALAGEKPHAKPLEPVTLRFASLASHETPSFQRHVVPLLGKLSCNGRACHGSFQGRGGFRLSLFGYDFKMDHAALMAGDEPRVNPRDPDASLILQKPTLRIPHEGGERYKLGSWEHHVLLRWIESGAAGVKEGDARLARLEVIPPEITFAKKGDRIALKVVAHWTDGTAEEVTPLCRFQTNDEQVAKIDSVGTVTAAAPGDTNAVVFYDAGIVPVPVMRPVSDKVGPRYPDVPTPTEIDRLVVKKLRKLGIVPSEVCGDAEFLRRVSLDITGTLPTGGEVSDFLADRSPDKRRRKIDALLERPAYAAWWTTRLCDMTGDNDRDLANVTPVDQRASQEWYDWILERVGKNVPYDQLTAAIVVATSRPASQTYTAYAQEMTDLYHKDTRHRYADRPTLTHFWARRTVAQPKQKALAFAHVFLGVRIQCAECHKHPFDQWTQQDYQDFTKFFTRVRYGVSPAAKSEHAVIVAPIQARIKNGNNIRVEYPRALAEGMILPFDEVYVDPARPAAAPRKPAVRAKAPPTKRPQKVVQSKPVKEQATPAVSAAGKPALGEPGIANASPPKTAAAKSAKPQPKPSTAGSAAMPALAKASARKARVAARKRASRVVNRQLARLLGGETIDLTHYNDPRVPLMDWLRSKGNRYFARAFVNRVWAGYFSVGIVNPPDNLSLANPASNAELLDFLADGFISHKYDMKWLHREIANSRTYQLSWRPNDTNRLDQTNFSHAVIRRLPAEVAYDAVRQATASDATVASLQKNCAERAIGMPGTGQYVRRIPVYALNVFGRSTRASNCDCDRSDDPTLLQTVFLRNDAEVMGMLNDRKSGWVAQIADELRPKRPAAKPAKTVVKSLPTKNSAVKKSSDSKKLAQSSPTNSSTKNSPAKDLIVKRSAIRAPRPIAAAQVKQAAAAKRKIAADARKAKAARRAVLDLPRPSALPAAKKAELVRRAYLRTLNRDPDPQEAKRSLAYLDDSKTVDTGLRDLVWALINTREFIVNH